MSNDKLAEALEMARNGLRWYQDRYPNEVNGCDDEAMATIDAALQAHAAEAARAQSVPGELAEPIEGAFNYEQKLAFTEGWNACRDAMLAAAPQQAAEPVAWRCTWARTKWSQYHDEEDPLPDKWDDDPPDQILPLYTHPQPAQDARLPSDEDFRLHLGELTSAELRVAQAAARYVLAGERAQDAKDAARYRWLRDKSGRDGQPYIRCDDPPFEPMDYWVTAGTADACIDRAMAKESWR